MKQIIKYIFFSLATFTVLTSCEKDQILATLNESAQPVVTLSAPTVVLLKDNEDQQVLSVSWTEPDFGFAAGPIYSVLIDKKGGNFENPYVFGAGTALSKTFKGSELNGILLGLGLKPEEAEDLIVKVQAKLSDQHILNSPVVGLNATPYANVLDLTTSWGVVGSGYNDWGATPDGPFYQTGTANVYVAYLKLIDGEIKFRKDSDWGVNYGDNGADGTLEADGENIAVKAGTYKIILDLSNLTYKIEPYSWGIVGSGYNDWGATPDGELSYDPYSDTWRTLIPLIDGEIKFRKNSDWAENYGDNGATGTLDNGGDNIAVTKGNYLVTVNFKENTYSLQKVTNLWGVVGSATPNEWDGPDVPMNLDYSKYSADFDTKGVWIANNVVLKSGEIKFRANNDWGLNYGDNEPDGILEEGGENIVVSTGTYDITLDFSSGQAIYSLKKK